MKASQREKPKRLGCETPRIFTPPLRKLTPKTSRGFEVIEFAEILGIELLPWEKWLLIHALELNRDGTFRFRTVILLVARQNGKSLVMQILALWRMFIDAAQMVIGTAQNLDISEEQWSAAVEMAEATPELAERIKHVDKTNGKKALRLVSYVDADGHMRGGERYKVAAANRKGGRGLSGDLIIMDELREHTSWDSWAAVTKTTMARTHAQIWAASNAGDAASIVLRHLRNMAHAELGNPDNIDNLHEVTVPAEWSDDDDREESSIGIFEWSAPPGCSIWDRGGWAQANPSLGYTITEAAIAAAARTDPEGIFRTEVLCQWLDTTKDGPFPDGQWAKAKDPGSEIVGPFMYCVDVSADRTTTHIAAVGLRADGIAHVEIVATRAGTAWVKPWFDSPPPDGTVKRKDDPDCLGVTLQANGAPVSSLLPELEALDGLNVIPWAGSDLGRGTGMFYDLVRGLGQDADGADLPEADRPPLLRHRGQPPLDLAASMAATKPTGDAWLWDRNRSLVDIAPLVAVTGAWWAFIAARPEPAKESKYEREDLLTINW